MAWSQTPEGGPYNVAVRIYALAKELGLDNKALLDVCDKVGIKGKGSALASLEDDEVGKIKQFLENGEQTKAKSPASSQATTAELAAPVRDDILPSRPAGVRDLNQRAKRSAERIEKTTAPAAKKTGLNIKLAEMPEVKQPAPTAEPQEKIQKPDIALPQEAIRDAMRKKAIAGNTSAPLEEFTKTKVKPKKKGKAAAEVETPPTAFELEKAPLTGRRRGGKREKGAKDEKLDADLGSTRQARVRTRRRSESEDDDRPTSRRRAIRRRSGPTVNTAAPRKDKVLLELPCTVRSFSEAAGVAAVKVLLTLQQLGDESSSSINSPIQDEMVDLLIEHFGIEHVEIKQPESLEEKLITHLEGEPDDPADLQPRPPVVTFLGHVDHGKTSLLDAIIGIDVVSGEAGGITQHIRAYAIQKNNQKIAFVDTPGHEAFTEMRARGANVTDIAVLVVAADDGVMPQTEEAISHAKAAGVPIVVALNKIDLPGADPDKALQDLASHELLPSEWGGDIEVVRTSATQGTGIDELLETILVTAELHEYKANPSRPAVGTCLEAEQEPGRGVIAKVIVQNGTLKVGDVVVCGAAHGRVKALYDTLSANKTVKQAGPSMPVNLTGLDVAPEAGDRFYVLEDIADARQLASSRELQTRHRSLSGITTRVSLQEFQERLESGTLGEVEDVVTLNLIIRADVRGSIEAIQKELSKLDHPEIRINILQALVGGITVADVRLAQASAAVIIGFNVVPDEAARSLADDLQVEIRRYDVIYKVTDDIRATLEGRLKPDEQTVELGMAMVLRVFNISRVGAIAGCRVMRGHIERGCRIRVIRESRIIGDYALDSLKREKDDAKEVQRGMECGIKLAGFNDVKEGDSLEAYKIEEVARTL